MVIRLHSGLVLLLMFVGCAHRNDPTLDLMQSEMRWLEDQVYMLEGELEQTCYDLCKCRQASRDQMIWQQASTVESSGGSNSIPGQPIPVVMDSQGGSPSIPVVESPIVEPVYDSGGEPQRMDAPVENPGFVEMPPGEGVPLDALPYELVPGGPFVNGCPDCEPVVDSSDISFDDGTAVPMVTGEDDSTIEMNTAPEESESSLDQLENDLQANGMQTDEPAELPAPIDPMPSEDDTFSPESRIPPIPSAEPSDSDFESSDMTPPGSTEGDVDSDDFSPEPALPPAGEPPTIEDSNGNLDARRPDSDRFSIRLQSYVQSERIDPQSDPREPLRLFAEEEAGTPGERIDAHVTHLVVNARLLEWDQHYATVKDHDLIVNVQPRNADGKYVELPAEMSLVVLDRNQSPENARVARWDFDATEVAGFVQDESRTGIRMELDWPGARPDSDELFVFVRYTTIDGRKLEARAKLLPPAKEDRIANEQNGKGNLTLATKGSHQWSQVPASPTTGWQVVDIGGEADSTSNTNGTPTHATVGYESAGRPSQSPSMTEWTQKRVSRLAAGVPLSKPDRDKPGKTVDEPKPLQASAIQNVTPIIEKTRVDKPTWKPYR